QQQEQRLGCGDQDVGGPGALFAAVLGAGVAEPDLTVAVRTGDTSAEDRRKQSTRPADILITTPESLFLLLTSQARQTLRSVETVIVDEVHAVAGTKRGAHLALCLERLDALKAPQDQKIQRIGLSATVRPVDVVATFLGGPARTVRTIQPETSKRIDLTITVPVEDMTDLDAAARDPDDPTERKSIWPHVEERVLDLIESHKSTIVFANSRRLAERLCGKLNELAAERSGTDTEVARAHHGSVSRLERQEIEEALKQGSLPAVVATSSLELGIDMGAVDLVIQVESPPSVASGLQRTGRAGHNVGDVSKAIFFPKYQGDLLQAAVVAERMRSGEIEELKIPRNPLDVLAQQIVAMAAMDEWHITGLHDAIRKAAPFASLTRPVLDATLDMLAGRYPSEDFAGLRPRIVWDRIHDTIKARPGAQHLAVTSGGTIPDRGLFGVFLPASDSKQARRVGELDEEMVYESRVGEVFVLGASSWRIEDITADRVIVIPAPGQPGKLPFWIGDTPGRPAELGKAIGARTRELIGKDQAKATADLTAQGLDERAARNLLRYLQDQQKATGYVPDDRTLVVERFRDELGDWRIVLHSPYGDRVHAPWALAITTKLRERYQDMDVQAVHSDDGIIIRVPDADEPPPAGIALIDPEDISDIITTEVTGSALFASRFRECAGRALLLPRRQPGRRTPLWQQRQRASQLLQVAAQYPEFPIVLETVRECLQDVFDVPALTSLLSDIAARRVRVVEVETAAPSPFSKSLLFKYIGAFMYEGDAPLAERRAQALTLDPSLLAELLGTDGLREVLDPAVVAQTERDLQRLSDDHKAASLEKVADLLRSHGPLTAAEVQDRTDGPAADWLAELEADRRVIQIRISGQQMYAAIEDAGRLRDALGVALPVGIPEAFTEPVPDPLGDLVARYARTRGPFPALTLAQRYGLGPAIITMALRRLAPRVVEGDFDIAGGGWCDADVLRLLRRRCLARLRKDVEPVPAEVLGRFLPLWHGIASGRTRHADPAAVLEAIERLAGAPVPASSLETMVLPSRVPGYSPALLDELTAAGEVTWCGAGALPGGDGWVALAPTDIATLVLPAPAELTTTPLHAAILDILERGGGLFFRALSDRVGATSDVELAAVIWDLVWSGRVTNDTLAPLRVTLSSTSRPQRPQAAPSPRARSGGRYRFGRPSMPVRTGPPTVSGRWSLLPPPGEDQTVRVHAQAMTLLDRHGVLTRGAVAAERLPGGFSAIYPVLRAAEEAGQCRRGYFVEGLGAAQFALAGAVDRLRALASAEDLGTVVLPAADPAQPYGAALPWPDRADEAATGHRPGRKAGALVVLHQGELVLYVERGGKTLLSWTSDPDVLEPAASALAGAVRAGALGRLTVERADGAGVYDSPLAVALESAGFRPTPRGLRLRATALQQ
ncbi:MAG TPA: helicase-related protein, partial [Streptosporangiaceae bacterium]|nr:helicase-related protein [Streptosporangiaceae bacterium]